MSFYGRCSPCAPPPCQPQCSPCSPMAGPPASGSGGGGVYRRGEDGVFRRGGDEGMASLPEMLTANKDVLGEEDFEFATTLVSLGQEHMFAEWDAPGTNDEDKRAFIAQARKLNEQYPGGLAAYCSNAKELLEASKSGANPYDGFSVEVPQGERLTPGDEQFTAMEAKGMENIADAAFVMVAGGMGERLGYKGIKIELPMELSTNRCFLETYCQNILAFQAHARAVTGNSELLLPLCIMTSGDTHPGTVALLEANDYFGMEKDTQLILVQQEKVPSLIDNDARISTNGPYEIETKPHGHGDVHLLLHMSGVAQRWQDEGRKWVFFFQDTNGLVFRAVPSCLGVSTSKDFDVNSVTVPRSPGEAVGAICRLKHSDGRDLTLNVEYNQLDPLLRSTVSPEGDTAAEGSRFSPFPGNLNVLLFKLAPYVEVLNKTNGTIAEFVNPKYKDDTKTVFKKPTRLECMMQDYPKLLDASAKVGFTQLERWMCFSAVKNNIVDAAAKAEKTGFGECASSGEADAYFCDRNILAMGGVKVEAEGEKIPYADIPVQMGAKVLVFPSAAVTFAGIQALFPTPDAVAISPTSTLIVSGPGKVTIKSLNLDGALIIKAPAGEEVVVEDCTVKNDGYVYNAADDDSDIYCAMRGFSLAKKGEYVHDVAGPLTGSV